MDRTGSLGRGWETSPSLGISWINVPVYFKHTNKLAPGSPFELSEPV